MAEKFWQQVETGLANQWIARMLAPAFVFWVGGVAAMGLRVGFDGLYTWWTGLSAVEQAVLLFLGLLLVSVSAAIVEGLQELALRLMEGYWPYPFRGLRFSLAQGSARNIQKLEDKWQELALKCDGNPAALAPRERAEYNQLDYLRLRFPIDPALMMPTRLGNFLRAAEEYPQVRYGLSTPVCWPRLWMLLPKEVQQDIITTREKLYATVRLCVWGMLFTVWTPLHLLALPLGLLVAMLTYTFGTLDVALDYGELLRAAFDLYRFKLYEQLGFPRPTLEDEAACGIQLTCYLARGELPALE